ncbi:MAG TPA: hypothetical protein DC057_01130 [Spirochaetia bacterium]|nr:hypothetical protein [Spirochaetia bacterium]
MKQITFFKDNADNRYAGNTFDLIPCKWSSESSSYVECSEDEKSTLWGIYAPEIGLSPFTYDVTLFGIITEK